MTLKKACPCCFLGYALESLETASRLRLRINHSVVAFETGSELYRIALQDRYLCKLLTAIAVPKTAPQCNFVTTPEHANAQNADLLIVHIVVNTLQCFLNDIFNISLIDRILRKSKGKHYMYTREKKSVSRAVRLTVLFRGKGKTVMTFDCCIKKQKYGMKCLQHYEIFQKMP